MPSQTACLPASTLVLASCRSSSVTGKSVHLSQLPFISQRVARLLSTEAWSQTHPSGKPFCLGGGVMGWELGGTGRFRGSKEKGHRREERPNSGSWRRNITEYLLPLIKTTLHHLPDCHDHSFLRLDWR